MKTYKYLYAQITAFENLYWAYCAARRGKRDRVAVADFEFDLEHNLLELQRELEQQTYRPGAYTNFTHNARNPRPQGCEGRSALGNEG
jgi:RNA-directed DNA polymerase